MEDLLELLRKDHVLETIDVHFARFVSELDDRSDPSTLLAFALTSRAAHTGDICLDLAAVSETVLMDHGSGHSPVVCPPLPHWQKKLRDSTVVGQPGDFCPLILDNHNRLYLYRFWKYEKILSENILRRARMDRSAQRIDFDLLRRSLNRLFPRSSKTGVDWQRVAALISVLGSFCVITGGPGTGKTTTVAAILAVLLELYPETAGRLYLAAPTGKAAARLGQALKSAREELPVSETIKDRFPVEAVTIHRMLGSIPGTSSFRHTADNPLPADTVIVDEASMVDLALMTRLVQALAERTRLILIGDKDQLASVESGAVLADLCGYQHGGGYSPKRIEIIESIAGEKIADVDDSASTSSELGDAIVVLRQSYRFSSDSGIGALGRAVNRGDATRAISLLKNPADPSVRWVPIAAAAELHQKLYAHLPALVGAYRKTTDPLRALTTFNQVGLLCAVNTGPFGVDRLNHLAEQLLSAHRLIEPAISTVDPWYAGRPVLITRNDYHLRLFNGDIGIALPASDDSDPQHPQSLLVNFEDPADGRLRQIPPYRLSDHQTAFAMTVHKSQGSEYETVHLVLPNRESKVLSRELIYTAVTRARRQIVIWGPEQVLVASIRRKIERSSGLRDALWGR